MSKNAFLDLDPGDLLAVLTALINTESVSKNEDKLCTDLMAYIAKIRPDAQIIRVNNSFVVQLNTLEGSLPVIFAGHLDTVPVAQYNGSSNNVARVEDGILYGLGASDMKSGLAVMIALIAEVEIPSSFIFYEAEEIEEHHSGLIKINDFDPNLIKGKWAVLLEPTNGSIELGCQGTISAKAIFNGKRAHSARPWMGENAIHKSVKTLDNLVKESQSQPQLEVEGLTYTAALSVTTLSGGVARNVIPDYCELVINHRYTPDISANEAEEYIKSLCSQADEVEIVDNTQGAMPSVDHPIVEYARQNSIKLVPKVAWTDVARFYKMGIPAVNCGPGDATFAHRADEHIEISKLQETFTMLKSFIS